MKKYVKFVLLAVLLPAFVFTSCKKDDDEDPKVPAFGTLKTHLVDNNMDIPNMLTSWVVDAKAIVDSSDYSIPAYYVLDIRSAADYAAGHIKNAVNTTLANVLEAAKNNGGKPILVACYSGQTASIAVIALRLSGYPDAKILKWGMSSWNPAFDKWTANTSSMAIGHTNWTMGPVASNIQFGDPDWTSDKTDGASILADRVATLLATGFQGVSNVEALTTPSNYFINNYWPSDTTAKYGHFVGAYRILPLSLKDGEYKYLDPSKTQLTYCYTGQTSAMVSAYLTVLGYNSKSLKYGTNSLVHSEMSANKWKNSYNYPFVQ